MAALEGTDFLPRTWDYEEPQPWRTRLLSKVNASKNFCLDWLTKYRIFRIPLLNWVIIVFYAIFLMRLTWRFKALYAQRALITMMVTNILLYGLADTLAQTLSSMIAFKPETQQSSSIFVRYILEKGRPRRVILDEEDEDLLELGLDNVLDDEGFRTETTRQPAQSPTASSDEIFHFRRLVLFTIWGFILSFVQSPWYGFLNSDIYQGDSKLISVIRRVLTDQLCFSPVSLFCFFTYTTVIMEGGDREAVWNKIKRSYLPTLGLNYAIWPSAQFFNFMVMPSPMQIPFSSTIGVFWNAYLSLKNARAANS